MKDSELIEAIKALPDGEILVQYASEAGLGLCGHEEWAGVDLKRLADNYEALLTAAKRVIRDANWELEGEIAALENLQSLLEQCGLSESDIYAEAAIEGANNDS